MAQVYKNFFFINQDFSFRRFGIKEPRLSETKQRKCATSIVERVNALPKTPPIVLQVYQFFLDQDKPVFNVE